MQTVTRAAELNQVMAVIEARPPRPKPTKADRKRKTKAARPARKILEKQLEDICRRIVFWRDGMECVEKELDGVRCNEVIQWGHYTPRQQSRWLKYDLGNTFAQCGSHNNLHDKGAQTMGVWFALKFGAETAKAMELERDAHRGKKNRSVVELAEMLARYDNLYENRYAMLGANIQQLVQAGYYGDIIREAWQKEGKLEKS